MCHVAHLSSPSVRGGLGGKRGGTSSIPMNGDVPRGTLQLGSTRGVCHVAHPGFLGKSTRFRSDLDEEGGRVPFRRGDVPRGTLRFWGGGEARWPCGAPAVILRLDKGWLFVGS